MAAALDHQDALADLRDRIFGLRCAIAGANFASNNDRAGLLRLVEDMSESQALKRIHPQLRSG